MTGPVVVVGGAGAVGSLLVERLRGDGAPVTVVDRATAENVVAGDVAAPTAEVRAVLSASSTVVLAVPEQVAIAAVPVLDGVLAPGVLLVETLSVKSRIHDLLCAARRPAVGINPMFAPALGMSGRPVAAVVHRGGPSVEAFLTRVGGWGAQVVRVGAGEHDRVTAVTQALTHAVVLAFGLALAELDADPGTVAATAPPPHRLLSALLARVGSGTPEVYHDIQARNPAAADARKALAGALDRLSGAVGDEAAFAAVMADALAPLGDRAAGYRELCAGMFEQLRDGGM
ncbi:prephenate dehydrogenase dimerization domain-containing protein [Prescottella sp. R16]|uniref:prephenate dehydrogenase dimerization domain-containing protein n=1 Tax=Prescottella sp. R16 TaxID=3064529 RepID=UPI00272EA302|nr:prephenate dehydrogenase dimerization domain-containing protein [Prescottella sp. R16]